MKIIRVICYEGDLESLQRQMASSLPDCKRQGTKGVTIEICTVVDERPKPAADVAAEQVRKMMKNWRPSAEPSLTPSLNSHEFAGDD